MFSRVLGMAVAERRINLTCIASGFINTKPGVYLPLNTSKPR